MEIDPNDLRIDVYRSSGPGGQSVNTTDSAVRITHLPTGIVVSCQNEKSQLQNKEAAMRVLRARLHQAAKEQAEAEASAARRSQVRTVDRSERIRTYNFPENRLSDHRTGFKAYNLDQVLDGDLDAVDRFLRRGRRAGPAGRGGRRVRRVAELRDAVRRATMTLAEAGVESAAVDALHLAAHLRGEDVSETRRLMVLGGVEAPDGYADLVAERASRVPLQHLTGRAHFRGLELEVGPGVFVPRPETELLVDLALRSLAGRDAPVVVDLATGSGAIALAVKEECPAATVYAVELTDLAHAWAVRNRDRLGLDVSVDRGDARHAYPELVDAVDVVTCNPPYIPDDQVPVDPEVRDHDPARGALRRQRRRTGSAPGDGRSCRGAAARRRHARHGARRHPGRRAAAGPAPARGTGTRSSTTSTCWAGRAVSWRPVIGCEVVT